VTVSLIIRAQSRYVGVLNFEEQTVAVRWIEASTALISISSEDKQSTLERI